MRTAALFAVRQGGSSATSLGGGPFIDHLKSYWGIILTACMLGHAITFAAIGGSPTFALLIVVVFFLSMPGSLWHLPSAAAISQRFPDRRGFAISMHGFGSNLGNVSGPVIAGALLGASFIIWRHVFFIYAGLALFMAVFVWWSLRGLGREDDGILRVRSLSEQFVSAAALLKNPVVMALIFAALLRGIGLNALFNWTPFYLRETLEMSTLQAGVYYALLTGMGIVSAPVLGWMSDKFGRKAVLAPGFVAAALLSLVVVSVGSSLLLIPVMAGLGLFSFALHQIIQASVLDYVGQGTEATAIGLLFGINGVIGIGSPSWPPSSSTTGAATAPSTTTPASSPSSPPSSSWSYPCATPTPLTPPHRAQRISPILSILCIHANSRFSPNWARMSQRRSLPPRSPPCYHDQRHGSAAHTQFLHHRPHRPR